MPRIVGCRWTWFCTQLRSLVAALVCASVTPICFAETPAATSFTAKDSLDITADPAPDAQSCLDRLSWMPGSFSVQVAPSAEEEYDALVSFPSPEASGDAINDRVTMEWYQPRAKEGETIGQRPAMVVVHESGSQMEAGRVFARSFRSRGLHAFLIHLPYYGERRKGGGRPENADFTILVRQGIADVRRARDAVAMLPGVESTRVGLQGTSLGGFVTTLVASLDHGYQDVFIMLAGADFYDILQSGQKDTAKLRDKFAQAGYEGERLRELLSPVESLRIAHRLDPAHTWMYSAQDDEVVPIRNARLLATTAKLDRSHQLEFPGGHYSVALYFPFIVDHVVQQMLPQSGAAGQ